MENEELRELKASYDKLRDDYGGLRTENSDLKLQVTFWSEIVADLVKKMVEVKRKTEHDDYDFYVD